MEVTPSESTQPREGDGKGCGGFLDDGVGSSVLAGRGLVSSAGVPGSCAQGPEPGNLGKNIRGESEGACSWLRALVAPLARWVVRLSPAQRVGTERSPAVMWTTSSFYQEDPRQGKPPTAAGLSSEAKCAQARLPNLGSRRGLHPERGATSAVWAVGPSARLWLGLAEAPTKPALPSTIPWGWAMEGDL